MTLHRLAITAALAVTVVWPVQAQQYFGQNQVQYDRFNWVVKETEHFLIYYYPEEARAATDAAMARKRKPMAAMALRTGHQSMAKPTVAVIARAPGAMNQLSTPSPRSA